MYYSWGVKQTRFNSYHALFSSCIGNMFVSNCRFVDLSVLYRAQIMVLYSRVYDELTRRSILTPNQAYDTQGPRTNQSYLTATIAFI
jgi:hypothetical protein